MKITIQVDEGFKELEITVSCNHISEEVEKLLASIRMLDMKLTGMKEGRRYLLDASSIVYVDTVDKKTFLYTVTETFETSLRLYELETKLGAADFLRAGKSCLFNFNYIKSLKADLDGRLILNMENDITLVVSRQYAAAVKSKLEV
jgi:DNA-binding LytR/AlgR family response regulator